MNFTQNFSELAKRQPHAPAIVLEKETASYADLDGMVRRLAGILKKSGVSRGDIVGIGMRTTPLHLIAILAAARVGAVSLSLRAAPRADRPGLARRFGMKAAVCNRAEHAIDGLPRIILAPGWARTPGVADAPPASFAADTPWRIFLSSGTTGAQKAMLYSHGDMLHATSRWKDVAPPIGAGTRILCLRGIETGFMLRSCLRHLLGGGAVEFARSTGLEAMISAFGRGEITHAVLSPPVLAAVCERLGNGGPHFPHLTHLAVGGATSSPALIALAEAKITPHVYSQYGASEAGIVAIANSALLRDRPESAGRLVPWLEAQVVDDDDHALAVGETGVLRFRGPGVAKEYYLDPEASARMFRDGWFYPGDIGRIGADGLLFIEGRADERINLGGVKIDPAEIERVIESHPEVVEAGVFASRGAHDSEILCAAVVLRHPLPVGALTEHCRASLTAQKRPARFFSLRKLPRNDSDKLLRRELERLVKERAARRANAQK